MRSGLQLYSFDAKICWVPATLIPPIGSSVYRRIHGRFTDSVTILTKELVAEK